MRHVGLVEGTEVPEGEFRASDERGEDVYCLIVGEHGLNRDCGGGWEGEEGVIFVIGFDWHVGVTADAKRPNY